MILLAADLQRVERGSLDVAGDVQHLLEALPLVQALGEPETRPGDGRERLAPAHQIPGEVSGSDLAHGSTLRHDQIAWTSSSTGVTSPV